MKKPIYFIRVFALAGALILLLAACGYSTATPLPAVTPTPTKPLATAEATATYAATTLVPAPELAKPLTTAEVTATAAASLAQGKLKYIDEAEQKWKAQSIASYRIKVKWPPNYWEQYRIEGIVKNGQLTGQSVACIPSQYSKDGKCPDPGFSSASGVVVPALFATARRLVAEEQASNLDGRNNRFSIGFDLIYSFPITMHYYVNKVTDSDSWWEVELFEVLQ